MRSALRNAHPLSQFAVLVLIGMVAMGVMLGLAFVVMIALGIDPDFLQHLSSVKDPYGKEAWALKVMQIVQALGLFVTPYLVFRWLDPPFAYSFRLTSSGWVMAAVFALSIFASLPLINALADWNSSLQLPEVLGGVQQWIEESESNATQLIELFLVMDGPAMLAFNLFLIALLPAIGEELFFRGTLQPLVLRSVKNHHLAIWITACFFSFFHMQFLGFFPRLLLGAVFGYAAHWSGTLTLPMIGHFVNNGVAVLIAYYIGADRLSERAETMGANEGEWAYAVFSAGVLLSGLLAIRRRAAAESS